MSADHSSPLPLRQNRNFQLLWAGQAVSVLGSNFSMVAYPLLVLALTGSAASAGIVGFLRSLPFALLQLPAGALVDRWNRRRVMLVCDAGRFSVLVCVAAVVVTGHASVPLLAVAAFAEGSFTVFFSAAEAGALRHVVPDVHLTQAIAQNEARTRGATLAGQPLGGVLFGLGHAVPFIADATSYLISFVTLGFIRVPFNDERVASGKHKLAEIREGLLWLLRQSFLRACTLLVAGSNFAFQALVLTVIVYAKEEGASPGQIGIMLGGFGAGGLIGAFLAPWLQPKISPRLIIVGANWVWAVFVLPIALLSHPYAIGLLLGCCAFVGPIWNVVIGAYEIRLTPDAMLGRVISVIGVISWGVIPFGSLIGGISLESFGSSWTLLAIALWMLATAIVATLNRSIRRTPPLI